MCVTNAFLIFESGNEYNNERDQPHKQYYCQNPASQT